MSGHSKWSTIKRKKGAADAERGKIFAKLAKEIYVAAKNGDADPMNNAALRMVIEKAKAENMPKSNIQNAIDKAKSKGNGENYEQVRYEGYGPNGMAIMIDCLTDNRNRTAGFVRSSLTKRGGNLGTDGSVSYLFKRKGLLILSNEYDEETLMTDCLELDMEDFVPTEEGYEITTTPEAFLSVKEALEEKGYTNYIMSEVTYIPDNYITLDEETCEKALALIETLEDIDDVQAVYHNLDI